MPEPVRVFLSTVSDEFRAYRDQLRGDLTRPNVEVKIQEDFKDLGGVTLEKLDEYIKRCDAVVHLVGDVTGAFARNPSTKAILDKYPDLPGKLAPLGALGQGCRRARDHRGVLWAGSSQCRGRPCKLPLAPDSYFVPSPARQMYVCPVNRTEVFHVKHFCPLIAMPSSTGVLGCLDALAHGSALMRRQARSPGGRAARRDGRKIQALSQHRRRRSSPALPRARGIGRGSRFS